MKDNSNIPLSINSLDDLRDYQIPIELAMNVKKSLIKMNPKNPQTINKKYSLDIEGIILRNVKIYALEKLQNYLEKESKI